MVFHVMTLFPDMIRQVLDTSILKRASLKGLINVNAVNIRDFANNKHNSVDDYPYGGGAGMVMSAEPVVNCYEHIVLNSSVNNKRVVYLTPQGQVFNQSIAQELAKEEELILLCGHYEGIDERALDMIATDYISIGDYVLTGGELPAMVMIDAVSRLIPGVLNNNVSAEFESFHDNLLEYPHYTRPEVFMDRKVPEVLLSGHHANIEKWRREQSIIRTMERREDLMKNAVLSKNESEFYNKLKNGTEV